MKYNIVLLSIEENKELIISKLSEMLKLPEAEARDLVNNIPCTIKKNVDAEYAAEIKTLFSVIGAKIEVVKEADNLGSQSVKTVSAPTPPGNQEETTFAEDVGGCLAEIGHGIWKLISGAAIVIILIIVFFNFINGDSVEDLVSYFDNGQMYIEMVQDICPFQSGRSYYQAFSDNFDTVNWEYFKSEDNRRVVQVTARFNDINDELITQFLLTPTEEAGQFYVEPHAMRVSGADLSSYEMELVLAAIFDNESVDALGELFFYGNLLN